MRQACCTENKAENQRETVLEIKPSSRLGVFTHRTQQLAVAEVELAERKRHDDKHRCPQQDTLDDLVVGGRTHSTEHNVECDQRSGDDNSEDIIPSEKQPQELSSAHHLRDNVEQRYHQCSNHRRDAERLRMKPSGYEVCDCVGPEPANRTGQE